MSGRTREPGIISFGEAGRGMCDGGDKPFAASN